MKLRNEADVLDIQYRQQIIKEILGNENQARKQEQLRRYECYRDNTKKHVLSLLLKMFDSETVNEMQYAVANVSIVKKIVNKLARVYSNGVTRTVPGDQAATQTVQDVSKNLSLDSVMKSENRFLKLQQNSAIYMRTPEIPGRPGVRHIQPTPLLAHQFDVIEDEQNPTIPICVILSYFHEAGAPTRSVTNEQAAGRAIQSPEIVPSSDGKDQKIADPDTGADKNNFIWWTNSYHFTTDKNGEIIAAPEQNINPIGILPFVFFAYDNDGNFWSQAGKDLVDSSLTINSLLSHINHIGVVQGYGQFWMKGKNLPKVIKTGPNKAILMSQAEGEPEPAIGFANANPPIESLLSLLETQVALLLTTNDLSTSGVSLKLSGQSAASGIALIIDKAESLEDVADQAQQFIDKEPLLFDLFRRWHEVLVRENALVESQAPYVLPSDIKETLHLHFGMPQPLVTEKEKIEIIKLRRDAGLDSLIDSIMRDNPGMTEEQAEEKAAKLKQDDNVEEDKEAPIPPAKELKPEEGDLM